MSDRLTYRQPSIDKLERWKSIASIASSVALPLVLAVVGYLIQKQLADEGLKKDYVAIAVGILKENPTNQEPGTRKWAVEVLDANSPIPFSSQTKAGLERGKGFIFVQPARIPGPLPECMKAPSKPRVIPLISELSKKGPPNIDELAASYTKLLDTAFQSEAEASYDRVNLTCLQRYARLVEKWSEETARDYAGWSAASAASGGEH